MDLIIFSMLFTIVAFFFSLPLIARKKLQSSITSSVLPPGSTGWPIIGESLEFLNAGLRGVPDKFVTDRMQKFSSQIFRTSLFGEAVAVLCGPEGNKFLFTNENKLVTVWLPPSLSKIFFPSAQSSIGEELLKTRKMLVGFLKVEPLHKHVSVIDAIAKKLVKERFDNQKEVTVLPLVKSYTFSIACKLFMSIDDPIQLAKFLDLISVLVSGMVSLPIDLPGTPFNRAIKASNLLRKKMLEIVKQRKSDLAERKTSPGQDLLSHVLVTSDESRQFMEEYDIADKILGLIVAGLDTTTAAITFVIKYLAELPHVYDEVHKEQVEIFNDKASGDPLNWDDIQRMRYSWNVACEVMRLVPPTQGFFQEALADFAYNGFYVPKGWKLFWSTFSTHKNPTYFPEPEKFDPLRFEGNGPAPYTFVAFGGGPRMCPGKEYVRLVILVFMHNIVTKFKWEKVLYEEKIVVNPAPMPAKGLLVRLKPHV